MTYPSVVTPSRDGPCALAICVPWGGGGGGRFASTGAASAGGGGRPVSCPPFDPSRGAPSTPPPSPDPGPPFPLSLLPQPSAAAKDETTTSKPREERRIGTSHLFQGQPTRFNVTSGAAQAGLSLIDRSV